MSNNDISDELKAIADNFESKNYGVVVQQALLLIEKKLREVIKRDFTQLDSATQSKIHKHLSSLEKPIDELTMGKIVGLLRATKFFDAWKQQFNKELRIFETIDLNKLVDLRNGTTHGTRTTPFTREEAEFVIYCQRIVLQTFDPTLTLNFSPTSWVKIAKYPLVIFSVVVILGAFGILITLVDLWTGAENPMEIVSVVTKEIAELSERAKRGDINAQIMLGEAYYNGEKVDKNYSKARELFEKAAAQGEPKALNWLGVIYARGRGVPQDYLRAKELFEKAAEQNFVAAVLNLLKMYMDGLGVPKDEKRREELTEQFKRIGLQTSGFVTDMSMQLFDVDGYKELMKYIEQAPSQLPEPVIPQELPQPAPAITLPVGLPQQLSEPNIAMDAPPPQNAPVQGTFTPEATDIPKQPSDQKFIGCHAVTAIPREECETLVKFYQNTDGENWLYRKGWMSSNNPCEWIDVTCENGRVVKLSLWTTSLLPGNLKGEIPDISQLKNLNELKLSNNQLSGVIPDLSQLKNLKDVYLAHNRLRGEIPNLSQSRNLAVLWLSSNQLSGAIPDLSQVKNLVVLYLPNNQLSGTIPDLSQLKDLGRLNLSDNQLSGTIPDLSQLKNLNEFNLSNNQLSGTIPDLSQLTKLWSFNISGNLLCRAPNIQYPEKWQEEVNQYPLCASNQ